MKITRSVTFTYPNKQRVSIALHDFATVTFTNGNRSFIASGEVIALQFSKLAPQVFEAITILPDRGEPVTIIKDRIRQIRRIKEEY